MDECRKRALILGVNGQDGSYLAELLCEKGYEVHGACRSRRSNFILKPLPVRYHRFDLLDETSLIRIISNTKPHELYNLAGPSRPTASVKDSGYYLAACAFAVRGILDAVREYCPECRVFQAGSSEVFGDTAWSPQNVLTPPRPRNPYGLAKQLAADIVNYYRRSSGIFAVNGILFNHESPLRPLDFVSQKIVLAVVKMHRGRSRGVKLGNKLCRRDWTHARDIVRGMWMSLQHTAALDYVFASGVTHSVEEMVHTAARLYGLPRPPWISKVQRFWQPCEPVELVGDAKFTHATLGWEPQLSFDGMLHDMLIHMDRRLK